MSEIARWAGHTFEVTPKMVLSLNALAITSGVETDDVETGGQQYVKKKAGRAAEITFEVPLSGYLGVDVRSEAMRLIDEARKGTQDYFYIGGSKLMTCQMMLTEASVTETQIAPSGTWAACKVALTMQQSSKFDGEADAGAGDSGGAGGSSSGGSKKRSVKTQTPMERLLETAGSRASSVKAAVEKAGKTVTAVGEIKRMTSSAKSKTASSKALGKGLIAKDR